MSGGNDAILVDAFRAYAAAAAADGPPPLPGEETAQPPTFTQAPEPKRILRDQTLADGTAVPIQATVVTASGKPVTLTVTVRRVYIKGGELTIFGLVHELRNDRSFKVSEIMQIADPQTGRTSDDVQNFIIRNIVRSDDQTMKNIL